MNYCFTCKHFLVVANRDVGFCLMSKKCIEVDKEVGNCKFYGVD